MTDPRATHPPLPTTTLLLSESFEAGHGKWSFSVNG
jgi:hypothetical protein